MGHALHCPACADLLGEHERMLYGFAQCPVPAPPADLAARVVADLAVAPQAGHHRAGKRVAVAIAVAVAIMLAAMPFLPQSDRDAVASRDDRIPPSAGLLAHPTAKGRSTPRRWNRN